MQQHQVDAVKRDLEAIERVVDVRVWSDPLPVRMEEGGRAVVPGVAKRICVEAVPADSTKFLVDVMKDHCLVITEVRCGSEGLIADLRHVDDVLDAFDEHHADD